MSFSTAQMDGNHKNDSHALPLLHRMQLNSGFNQQSSPAMHQMVNDSMSTLKMRMACTGSNFEPVTTNTPVEIKVLNTEHNNPPCSSHESPANNESVTVTYNTAKDFAANYFANRVQVANSQLNHQHVHEALKDHKLHVENLLQQSSEMQNEQELHAEALMDHKQHTEQNNKAIKKLSTNYKSLNQNVETHGAQIAELQNMVQRTATHGAQIAELKSMVQRTATHGEIAELKNMVQHTATHGAQIAELKNMVHNTNQAVSQHKRLIERNMMTPARNTRAWS
jgi:hypothetical protein